MIIEKPGTPGAENAPAVIIQAHLDMVCEKNADSDHDFSKDPLKLFIDYCEDGEWLGALGTSLGADDGIGVAIALALLHAPKSELVSHPPLKILLTSDEEAGMGGAKNLDPTTLLDAQALINIDSDVEGEFIIGCAGGVVAETQLRPCAVEAPEEFCSLSARVFGLLGGHSGSDIHLNRANANIVMSRILRSMLDNHEIYIKSIRGGSKDNAIPRECEAIIMARKPTDAISAFDALASGIRQEYVSSEPEFSYTIEKYEIEPSTTESASFEPNINESITNKKLSQAPNPSRAELVFEQSFSKTLLDTILSLPCGVLKMSEAIPDLVQSSANVGVVRADNLTSDSKIASDTSGVAITCLMRSSVKHDLDEMLKKVKNMADVVGGAVFTRGDYPAWEAKRESGLAKLFCESFKELFGYSARVSIVHAGLECGLFAEKLPGVDMISFGPLMRDIHSPGERLHVRSVGRAYALLCDVLSKM